MRVVFDKLQKKFLTLHGFVEAIRDVSLTVEEGELFVLLGPSGCGKSTLLNLAAGLEKPTGGEIAFGDQIVASPSRGIFVPPRQRNVAMVFQSYALYPHMSVFENIAFPLKISKEKKKSIHREVRIAAEMLGIEKLLDRKPGELSGGQRQRVAMARALVRRPALFLLDEPLSNLDAQLRTSTRAELKGLQRELKVTTFYVTHDQTEAMTLGDRIALLNDGKAVQVGSPEDLYDRPATPFAAQFIGSAPMNLVSGAWNEAEGRVRIQIGQVSLQVLPGVEQKAREMRRKEILVGVRPEDLRVVKPGKDDSLGGTVVAVEPLGRESLLHVKTTSGEFLVLSPEKEYALHDKISLEITPEKIHVFPRET